MKLLLEYNQFLDLDILKSDNVFGVSLAVNGFYLDSQYSFDLGELKSICKKIKSFNKKVFLNCQMLFLNNDFEKFRDVLELDFDYIIYSDLGVKTFINNYRSDLETCFYGPIYLNNSRDIELFLKDNSYVFISDLLNKEEIQTISQNISDGLIINFFSCSSMFYSKRRLLSNYYDYRMLHNMPKSSFLIEETRTEKLHIVEDFSGTHIYEDKIHIFSELEYLKENDILYVGNTFLEPSLFNTAVNELILYINSQVSLNELKTSLEKLGIFLTNGMYDRKQVLVK